jgi:hypothetical protein
MWKAVLVPTLAVLALAQQNFAVANNDTIRGAALRPARLYTWGRTLTVWNLRPSAAPHILAASAHGGFGEGGCVDSSGKVYLQDGPQYGPLVAISPDGRRETWDPNIEMHDCTFTRLLGHNGLLITAYYGQIRFYEGPGIYTEIYSFYTPSRQAGLVLTDIDGDGRTDIVSGNYWIRSPAGFELPWRLFAINLRHEEPDSATMRIVSFQGALFETQAHAARGSLFRYTRPADPTQRWTEQAVAAGLHYPHALASSAAGLVLGENRGPGSRLFFSRDGTRLQQIGTTDGVHSAFFAGNRILTVGAQAIQWWPVPAQRRK